MSLGGFEKFRGRISLTIQLVKNAFWTRDPSLYYVSPDVDWAVNKVGRYMTQNLRERFNLETHVISNPRWLAGHIIHYGSLWEFTGSLAGKQNERNAVVTTVFHGNLDDPNPAFREALEKVLENQELLSMLVTSNHIMAERFAEWGVPMNKVVTIPIGIDLNIFRPWSKSESEEKRRELGIARDAFCIGSFHKDGVGWDKGLEPKLIKGPDVFLEVIEKLSRRQNLHVLLSAPARGFVKQGLERMNVPYSHFVLDHYPDLAPLYAALDAYLVTSREEGGPKGILEALASGVPLVSTRMGMAPDVIEDGVDGLLADVEDVGVLVRNLERLIAEPGLGKSLASAGLKKIADYDWPLIAAQYYEKVYAPLRDKVLGNRRDGRAD